MKKNKIGVVIVSILGVVALALAVFFLTKTFKTDKDDDKKTKKIETVYKTKDENEDVKDLYNLITKSQPDSLYQGKYLNRNNVLLEDAPKDKLSNKEIFFFIYPRLIEDVTKFKGIDGDEYLKEARKYFKDVDHPEGELEISGLMIKYNKDKNKYVESSPFGHGISDDPFYKYYYKFEDATKKGDKLTIRERFIVTDTKENNCNYKTSFYKDLDQEIKFGDIEYKYASMDCMDAKSTLKENREDYLKDYFKKAKFINYEFVKQDGSYKFEKSYISES